MVASWLFAISMVKCGKVMVAKMPMMAVTTINSTNVNPDVGFLPT